MLDKLTYAGRRGEPAGPADDRASSHGAIEDPRAVAGAIDAACDAIVNFAAETHVDRSIAEPDAFVQTHAQGTYVLLEAARERRAALRAGLDRRGLRLDRGGLVHRGVAAARRPRPTARRRPAPTCSSRATSTPTGSRRVICRGSNNYGPYQYPEKLIPLMVLNALHGDPLPVYGDGMQRAQLDLRRGLRPRHRPRARRTARRARSTTSAAPTRRRTSRSSSGSSSSTGADESLIEYVTDRPGHDRRYSPRLREGPRRWAGSRRCASTRASQRTVDWYRDNAWWWEPIRSGDYRAYYERHYGRALG